jgi:hypothetical protein
MRDASAGRFVFAVGLVVVAMGAFDLSAARAADSTIVIVRHGEKPDDGDNLSCEGLNRALALPAVLRRKFGKHAFTVAYVPKLALGEATKHARMFQTVTPFAVRQGLTVNSNFDEQDVDAIAADALQRSGTVLIVWEHSQIRPLALALHVPESKLPDEWKGKDFDSIWIVTPTKDGPSKFATDKESISPSSTCPKADQ